MTGVWSGTPSAAAIARSSRAPTPHPRRAEVMTTSTPGLTCSRLARNATSSNSTASARSVLVTTTRCASPKAVGYLRGLSSPSVTDARATLSVSPRS
jgi:hypothetical protein